MPATVDEVVERLTELVAGFRTSRSRLGYFAAVYLQMSAAIRVGIEREAFDDGARMSRFAAAFADRYLQALGTFRAGGRPTRSWRVAFERSAQADALILQHLVLGINAHVNLDLGIAAATVAPGPSIEGLRADFERINRIIGGFLDSTQDAIGRFSPLLDLLWRLADEPDDAILNFSFRVARDEAWRRARTLAALPLEAWPPTIDSFDRAVSVMAKLVARPGGITGGAIALVRHTESDDVPAVIDALAAIEIPDGP